MSMVICESCRAENDSAKFFCKECGGLLSRGEFTSKGISEEAELKLKRIMSNLRETPHYPILWNETIDSYTRKIEKVQKLLALKDMKLESRELNEKIKHFLELCQKPDFQIAFVGTIKTGKSTLINSLLGRNYASMDVTPETAALTKFRSSVKDYVHITFYNKKEWDELWKSVTKGADKFIEEYRELHADEQKEIWVGHADEHIEVANADIELELSKWSSSKSALHYFVKEIEIGISTLPKDFPKQVVFVDTPGLSDPVEYRSKISREYIHKANAVFVCVDAQKINRDEIETIASVFSFSSHNKSKVHVIATHWDALNYPKEEWEKQHPYMAGQLTGKAFFDTKEVAMKNIMYSAAYIYNLCRDYDNLDKKERKQLNVLALKLDMDVEIGMFTPDDVQKISDITNINKINQVIVDELVRNYQKLLYGDIQNLYEDIRHIVKRVADDRKQELGERISDSNISISEMQKKVAEKMKNRDEIRKSQKLLQAALDSMEKNTQERLKEITSQL